MPKNSCELSTKGWRVGDKVALKRDSSYIGEVSHIEDNGLSVMVMWEWCDGVDFQWSNKLTRLPDDYESCGDCGFDHSYESEHAAQWHTEHPGSYD